MEVAAWTAAAVVAVAVARWLGKAWQAAQGSTGNAKLPKLPTPQRRLPPPRYGERITVLSIDGGGIRGLIPTVVLASLEEELKVLEHSHSIPLSFETSSIKCWSVSKYSNNGL